MPDERDALDAYSTVVTAVANAVLPSVGGLAVRSRRGEGAGSASVITPDRYLLTSAHVVAGARSAQATLPTAPPWPPTSPAATSCPTWPC